MISQVPVEYMHLVNLGVMKRLLHLWCKGKKNVRLEPISIKRISELSLEMRKYIPKEFARKSRSLDDLDRWKATEFRLFLLYTGMVVLKDIIPRHLYEHFMCFSLAIRILCGKSHHSPLNIDYARELLLYFVRKF